MTVDIDFGPTRWHEDALCKQVDPECFFPEDDDIVDKQVWSLAKKFCSGCEARTACLVWALTEKELWGVWGGLGPSDRYMIPFKNEEITVEKVQAFLDGLDAKKTA